MADGEGTSVVVGSFLAKLNRKDKALQFPDDEGVARKGKEIQLAENERDGGSFPAKLKRKGKEIQLPDDEGVAKKRKAIQLDDDEENDGSFQIKPKKGKSISSPFLISISFSLDLLTRNPPIF